MKPRIALGFGDNVDYEIVWNSQVMEQLVDHYGIRQAELGSDGPIQSERDLVVSILGFLQAGKGGERWVASTEIVEAFAQRFDKLITLGGTSVRAAIAMHKLGWPAALHLVTINEHVRRLLPPDSVYVCSQAAESLYPHLIVQFGQHTVVRAGDIRISARRANRIIYHNDLDNIAVELTPRFAELITAADVLLVSGFNAMQSEELLHRRLDTLLQIMASLPSHAQVYYEDAGFYAPRFSTLILERLAGHIDIFSLNEDELQAHVGRPLDLLDADRVSAALADLHRLIPARILVVHSMYWALAYGTGDSMRVGEHVAPALHGGVTMATTRFRCGDDFSAADYQVTAALPPNPHGARFAAAITGVLGAQVCCVPVAHVDQGKATTIGLGDAFVGGFLPALLG